MSERISDVSPSAGIDSDASEPQSDEPHIHVNQTLTIGGTDDYPKASPLMGRVQRVFHGASNLITNRKLRRPKRESEIPDRNRPPSNPTDFSDFESGAPSPRSHSAELDLIRSHSEPLKNPSMRSDPPNSQRPSKLNYQTGSSSEDEDEATFSKKEHYKTKLDDLAMKIEEAEQERATLQRELEATDEGLPRRKKVIQDIKKMDDKLKKYGSRQRDLQAKIEGRRFSLQPMSAGKHNTSVLNRTKIQSAYSGIKEKFRGQVSGKRGSNLSLEASKDRNKIRIEGGQERKKENEEVATETGDDDTSSEKQMFSGGFVQSEMSMLNRELKGLRRDADHCEKLLHSLRAVAQSKDDRNHQTLLKLTRLIKEKESIIDSTKSWQSDLEKRLSANDSAIESLLANIATIQKVSDECCERVRLSHQEYETALDKMKAIEQQVMEESEPFSFDHVVDHLRGVADKAYNPDRSFAIQVIVLIALGLLLYILYKYVFGG